MTAPLDFARLLADRPNPEREAAVARHLEACGVPFTRHRFETAEGRGETFAVDVGAGDRVLVLCAHHDAVPGSPGANDNAAAVGILLTLLERLAASLPPKLRVRLLFTAAEERGYLGARQYVREANLAEVAGVLSLELCGIGDSVALWDVSDETPFLGRHPGLAGDRCHTPVAEAEQVLRRLLRPGGVGCRHRRDAFVEVIARIAARGYRIVSENHDQEQVDVFRL